MLCGWSGFPAPFTIPYRPSASPRCSSGAWFKSGQGCFNGLAHTIAWTLTGLKTKLPKDVVLGVSYNSDHSGPNPLGLSNSPTDALNVGLSPKVRAGHERYPGAIFWDTRFAGFTCAADAPDGNDGPFQTAIGTSPSVPYGAGGDSRSARYRSAPG
jgi:hypothetical protein